MVERTLLHMPSPLFPFSGSVDISVIQLGAWVLVGILAGLLSGVLTQLVYGFEDGFLKLPIHWMWWPLIGGLVIGLGGLIDPHALGVGYDNIAGLLQGDMVAEGRAAAARGQGDHLVGGARLRHLGRRARAAADHGRGDGRRAQRLSPRGEPGLLGAGRDGGDHGRHDALAADGDLLRGRADRQDRMCCCR